MKKKNVTMLISKMQLGVAMLIRFLILIWFFFSFFLFFFWCMHHVKAMLTSSTRCTFKPPLTLNAFLSSR